MFKIFYRNFRRMSTYFYPIPSDPTPTSDGSIPIPIRSTRTRFVRSPEPGDGSVGDRPTASRPIPRWWDRLWRHVSDPRPIPSPHPATTSTVAIWIDKWQFDRPPSDPRRHVPDRPGPPPDPWWVTRVGDGRWMGWDRPYDDRWTDGWDG